MKLKKNKQIIIVGFSIILLIIILIFVLSKKEKTKKPATTFITPTESVIPTVDSSVKINLKPIISGKEVLLTIEDIPSKTQLIDYELSYQTIKQGLQGVIGTIELEDNEKKYEKKITLGTCSSGTCVYHEVEGKIRLSLKFTGNYGEKIFEKEY